MTDFVSRAGQKLDHALGHFALEVAGKTCADLGSNTGGFVDVLLQRGAGKVYAVDTGPPHDGHSRGRLSNVGCAVQEGRRRTSGMASPTSPAGTSRSSG